MRVDVDTIICQMVFQLTYLPIHWSISFLKPFGLKFMISAFNLAVKPNFLFEKVDHSSNQSINSY